MITFVGVPVRRAGRPTCCLRGKIANFYRSKKATTTSERKKDEIETCDDIPTYLTAIIEIHLDPNRTHTYTQSHKHP